jgi:hypothetical protein
MAGAFLGSVTFQHRSQLVRFSQLVRSELPNPHAFVSFRFNDSQSSEFSKRFPDWNRTGVEFLGQSDLPETLARCIATLQNSVENLLFNLVF